MQRFATATGDLSVSDSWDEDGDLEVSAPSITQAAWLTRDGVRDLRDHLTALLGDAPGGILYRGQAVMPEPIPLRRPTALELAGIFRAAEASAYLDDEFDRFPQLTRALADVARRLEAFATLKETSQ